MRFLLVDRITAIERGKTASGIKNVTLSEDFFTHHFPAHPIMPGALITECLVQLADWLLREGSDFACVALPSAFESVKFHRLVRPGDQLKLQVHIAGGTGNEVQVKGEARADDQVVAVARFSMKTEAIEGFLTADAARELYRTIRGGAVNDGGNGA